MRSVTSPTQPKSSLHCTGLLRVSGTSDMQTDWFDRGGCMMLSMSRRTADGGIQPSGARAEQDTHSANSIPLPAGSIRSVPPFKFPDPLQAMFDAFVVLVWLLFLGALIGSLPLAIVLMVIAKPN